MRIAVVQPPLRDFYLTPHRMSAQGAHTVAALCRKAGHEAEVYNFPLLGGGATLPLPPELGHLRPFLFPDETGPVSFFSRFRRFGPAFGAAAETVAAGNPEAVFVSSFAYAYAEDALDFAREIEGHLPGVPLVAGGAGPSAGPAYYLGGNGGGRTGFDLVCSGEAETGLGEILARLGSRPGAEGGLVSVPAGTTGSDIEVAFTSTGNLGGRAFYSVAVSRGCPLACRFCSNHLAHGREFRTVPLSSIEKALPKTGGGRPLHINFEDDNLLLDWDYFREVLSLLSTRFPGASFSAENGLDYRLLDEKRLETLLAFGFDRFNLSLGAAEGSAARVQGRNLDLERHAGLVRLLSKRNVPSVTYFIAGLEGDTPESVARHLRLLAELPTLVGLSLFYPVPGLSGFDPPPERLRLHPGLARGSSAFPWTDTLSTAELVAAFRLARWINLTKKTDPTASDKELIAAAAAAKRLFTLRRAGTGPVPAPGSGSESERNFFS